MEQIFFLVLVAVVGLVRWFLQVAENKKNAETPEGAGSPRAQKPPANFPAQSEEERIRKFFEALGVPAAGTPPPGTTPRQITPKLRRAPRTILPVDPFPAPKMGGGLPPIAEAPPPFVNSAPPPPERPPPLPAPPTPAFQRASSAARSERVGDRFEVLELDQGTLDDFPQSIASQAESVLRPGRIPWGPGIATRLATPEGMREAIVLTEIFGPPRSMRPLIHEAIG